MSNPVPPSDRPWALDVHAHFNVPDDSLLDQAAKEGKSHRCHPTAHRAGSPGVPRMPATRC